MEKKYGMFIHYGPNSFMKMAWGDGTFAVEAFNPVNLATNAREWVATSKANCFDYIVVVCKHHDGFCLWDTKYSDYKITNSPAKVDLLKVIATECKKQQIKLGVYYSLWDKHFAEYDNDEIYASYMQNQLAELLTNYGDITEVWFDGAWDKDYPNSTWVFDENWILEKPDDFLLGTRWYWPMLYDLIHNLQPNCEVINNSGYDRPGVIKYLPIDVRTSERMNFILNEEIVNADPNHHQSYGQEKWILPLEYVTTLNPDWFYTGGTMYTQPSAKTVYEWYEQAVLTNNRLLLNLGPDQNGRIINCERDCLNEVTKLIKEKK